MKIKIEETRVDVSASALLFIANLACQLNDDELRKAHADYPNLLYGTEIMATELARSCQRVRDSCAKEKE